MNQEAKAIVTFDADNYLFDGPNPKNSHPLIYNADRFRLDLDKLLSREPRKRNRVKLIFQALRETVTHAPRNPRKEVLDAVQQFKEEMLSNGLNIGIAVLSGRSSALLGLTRSKIEAAGYGGIFEDFFLDPGYGSYQHKRKVIRELSSWGIPVFHHDDDAMAAAIVTNDIYTGTNTSAFLAIGNYRPEFLQKSGLVGFDNIYLCATAIAAIEQNKNLLPTLLRYRF